MAIDTEKFINYAARKIPNSDIAAAFGITPGRVTQLLDNEKVQERVQARRKQIALEELQDQDTLLSARQKLLRRINDLAEHTESLSEAVGAYEKLQRLKEHRVLEDMGRGRGPSLISLELPDFITARLSIELSRQNDIIEIDGRSMATMPTTVTHKLIKEHRQKRDQYNDRADEDGIDPPS